MLAAVWASCPLVENLEDKARMVVPHVFRRPGFWIALALVLVVAAFGLIRARGPEVHTVRVTRKNLEQHIVASGRVWVPTRVQVSAQTPGLILAVAVREGNHVKAGSLLVQLEDAKARAAVAQAEASVNEARARLNQLRRVGAVVANETLSRARTNLEHAQSDVARSEALANSGAIAPAALEDARRAAEISSSQKTAAEAQQISSGPRGDDSRVLQSSLVQTQAFLDASKVQLAQTRIVAQEDAVVLTRNVEPGDTVQPSQTLLVLSAGNAETQLVFQSDERNLSAIHLGQNARASADAYAERTFDGIVSYIAPAIDPNRGSVEVRLVVPSAPVYLRPDMTVSIDLTVAAKQQVLTLPSEAIRGTTSSAPWVFVVQQNRIARAAIKLGIRGESSVELLSILDEKVSVVLPDDQVLTVGQRVRELREER